MKAHLKNIIWIVIVLGFMFCITSLMMFILYTHHELSNDLYYMRNICSCLSAACLMVVLVVIKKDLDWPWNLDKEGWKKLYRLAFTESDRKRGAKW